MAACLVLAAATGLAAWRTAPAGPALRSARPLRQPAPICRVFSEEDDCDDCVDEGFRVQEHAWESLPSPQFDYKSSEDVWLLEGAAALSEYTSALAPEFEALRERPFFRYYGVDLLASCTYLPQQETPCELDACEIEPSDDVPERMLERDQNEYEFELDSWAR